MTQPLRRLTKLRRNRMIRTLYDDWELEHIQHFMGLKSLSTRTLNKILKSESSKRRDRMIRKLFKHWELEDIQRFMEAKPLSIRTMKFITRDVFPCVY